jgi:hypothetical protein
MKTTELSGAALDWAVAKVEGWKRELCYLNTEYPNYSENWSLVGPIIEREKIDLFFSEGGTCGAILMATEANPHPTPSYGTTPLIAVMRCYVASKLGDEVEIPEALNP